MGRPAITIFMILILQLFLVTVDSFGQVLKAHPESAIYNQDRPKSFEFPEFTAESTDQTTSGYYLFDIAPFIAIIDHFGNPLFYQYIPGGSRNFERQPNGSYSFYANSVKGFLVMNEFFQKTDTFVRVKENLIDFHEFSILENGNYIVLGYDRRVIDMSQHVEGGQVFATVTGMVFQELDPDRNLLFEWNSWDHISFMNSDPDIVDLTAQVIDYIHPNSIVPDTDGNFLLTSRNLSEVTKIDRATGEIIWRFGGLMNEFVFLNDAIGFSAPHSAIRLPNGNIAILDNGYGHELQYSRGVEYEVDEVSKTANLVRVSRATPDIFSTVMGNVASLPGNHLVVGWGKNSSNALLDEFDEEGEWIASIALPPESLFDAYKVSYLNRFDFFIVPDEDTLDFGLVEKGDSAELNVELSNQGVAPATLFAFIDASAQFKIVDELPLEIAAGESEQICLKYKPTASGSYFTPTYLHFTLDSTIVDEHMVACRLMLEGHSPSSSTRRENKPDEGIDIFPNPFTSSFSIEGTDDIEKVILWTVNGRKVAQRESRGGERILVDMSHLPAGIYVVELVFLDNRREFTKVVKGRQ